MLAGPPGLQPSQGGRRRAGDADIAAAGVLTAGQAAPAAPLPQSLRGQGHDGVDAAHPAVPPARPAVRRRGPRRATGAEAAAYAAGLTFRRSAGAPPCLPGLYIFPHLGLFSQRNQP